MLENGSCILKDKKAAMVFIRLSHRLAHNPAWAGSPVRIRPPQHEKILDFKC